MKYTLTVKIDGTMENEVKVFNHENLAIKAFAETIQFSDTLRAHLTSEAGWAVAMFESASIHIP